MKDGKLSNKQKAKLKQLRQEQQMKEATYENQNPKKKTRGRPKKVQPTIVNLTPRQKIMFKLIDLQTQLIKILAGLKLRLKSILQSLKL